MLTGTLFACRALVEVRLGDVCRSCCWPCIVAHYYIEVVVIGAETLCARLVQRRATFDQMVRCYRLRCHHARALSLLHNRSGKSLRHVSSIYFRRVSHGDAHFARACVCLLWREANLFSLKRILISAWFASNARALGHQGHGSLARSLARLAPIERAPKINWPTKLAGPNVRRRRPLCVRAVMHLLLNATC